MSKKDKCKEIKVGIAKKILPKKENSYILLSREEIKNMMEKKKIIGTIIGIICLWLCCTSISLASTDLYLKNLKYDVTLNEDGSAEIIEDWEIQIEDTNTLFKTFDLDPSKYTGITEVSIEEVQKNGNIKKFTPIQEEKYHVDKDCFYALKTNNTTFEIAWGAHAEDTTKRYRIRYKVENCIYSYQDGTQWYWQLIGNTSAIDAKWVEATIHLPKPVNTKEELRAWAHGPLNGNIQIISNQEIKLEVADLPAKTFVETRLLVPNYIFSQNPNVRSGNIKEEILQQEQQWADEANQKREKLQRKKENNRKILIGLFVVTEIIGLGLAILFISKIRKYKKELKQTPEIKKAEEYTYYRDIPNEKATPMDATFLYYFGIQSIQTKIPEIFSATMLELCRKGYIAFEVIKEKKQKVSITLNSSKDITKLAEDEQKIYEILKKVAQKNGNTFMMKELEKYLQNHAQDIVATFQQLETIEKKKQQENGNYDATIIKEAESWNAKMVGYILISIFSFFLMQLAFVPAIIAAVYTSKLYAKYHRLTQKGMDEKAMWKGLSKYMQDFSMMKEKEIPELVLWEKYLVFATAFGIADKVLKQLKITYPQITDTDYLAANGYTYLYLMYHPVFSTNFIHNMNDSIKTAYNYTNYSSGGGYGGGFSGGGGFGGGGGRNGRKITYYQKYNKKELVSFKSKLILFLCMIY